MGDFFLFLDHVIPPKFKTSKFEKYDGKTSLILYVTMYTHDMEAHIGNGVLFLA